MRSENSSIRGKNRAEPILRDEQFIPETLSTYCGLGKTRLYAELGSVKSVFSKAEQFSPRHAFSSTLASPARDLSRGERLLRTSRRLLAQCLSIPARRSLAQVPGLRNAMVASMGC